MLPFGGRLEGADNRKYVISEEECAKNVNHSISGLFCNATWDSITCWSPTPASQVAIQPCPLIFGASFDKNVYKKCGSDGQWTISEFWKGFGHSDYGECVDHISDIEEVFELKDKTGEPGSSSFVISSTKGIVAVTILTISLMLLLVSIISINFIIPRAVNQIAQYQISRHVFPVFIFDTVVNLAEKIFFLCEIHYGLAYRTVTNTPIMCEILITVKEYACVTTYMWLLLQCYYLQNRMSTGHHTNTSFVMYSLIGWGFPVIPTTIWVMSTALSHEVTCWSGYQFQKIIWIINSCKLALVFGTVLCLFYVIRELIKTTVLIEKSTRGRGGDNCCYRRLCYETVASFLFVCYMATILLVTILFNEASPSHRRSEIGDMICIVGESSKGVVLSILFWCFNQDIRALLEVNIRRISRHELVPSNDIEENVL